MLMHFLLMRIVTNTAASTCNMFGIDQVKVSKGRRQLISKGYGVVV